MMINMDDFHYALYHYTMTGDDCLLLGLRHVWLYDNMKLYIYTHTTHSFLFDALMPGHVTIATERI